MKQRPFTLITAALCLVALTATAEATEFRRADVETRSAADGLKDMFAEIVDRADDVVWIGYTVPQIPGHRSGCGDSRRRSCVCKLEREVSSYQTTDDDLYGRYSGDMTVLYRVEDNRVGRIRMFSDYCTIDAGGLTVYWLTDVDPLRSIDLLKSFVDHAAPGRRPHRDVAGSAVCAIAMHDHPDAFATLKSFVQPDRRESLRESAVFWIGETGGAEGVKELQRVLREDPSTDVRAHVTFALTLSDSPEALETLIDAARHDDDSEVREQAIFWLSQEASEKAIAAITDAIEDDPDTEVKEQAVFALSQLPRDEGVPLLIKVARTNRNPEVREQAIFWLGQSGDERALDFFEEILGR